jgi:hypothetical protein
MSEAFERPFRPVELSDATLTSFPVQDMAQQLVDVLPRHKCRGFHSAPPSPIEGSGDAEEDSWTLGH